MFLYSSLDVFNRVRHHVPPITAKQPKGCGAKLQGLRILSLWQPVTEARLFVCLDSGKTDVQASDIGAHCAILLILSSYFISSRGIK